MNDTIELDLREIGYMLLRRFWVILLCATLVGTSVLVYTVSFVAPTYKSSIKMRVSNNSSINNQYMSSSDRNVALSLVKSYVEMISSDTIMDKVAEATGLEISGSQIQEMMTISPVEDTELFEVSIVSQDPQMSADIANTIAEVAPQELQNHVSGSTVRPFSYARPANSRYAPNYVTNTILGLVIGAALAVLALVMQVLLDIHVKREEDLTKIFAVPVLGIVPEMVEEGEKKTPRKGRH